MPYIKSKLLFLFQLLVLTINYLFNKNFNEKKVIEEYVPDEGIVFDLGSNLGSYIKFVSKITKKKKINFHSFEPNSSLCKIQDKLSLSSKHSIVINALAVSETDGQVKYYERSISSHSSLDDSPKMSEISKTIDTYDVESIRVDSYCKKNDITRIDLLKIDAEGKDFEVLKTCESLLQEKNIKLIKIEVWAEDESLALISNLLNRYGYTLIGTTNLSYIANKLIFFDAYFLAE
mgnify:CR=1 FL=1